MRYVFLIALALPIAAHGQSSITATGPLTSPIATLPRTPMTADDIIKAAKDNRVVVVQDGKNLWPIVKDDQNGFAGGCTLRSGGSVECDDKLAPKIQTAQGLKPHACYGVKDDGNAGNVACGDKPAPAHATDPCHLEDQAQEVVRRVIAASQSEVNSPGASADTMRAVLRVARAVLPPGCNYP